MERHELAERVADAAALYDTEVEIRERARALELSPAAGAEVERLYGRAESLREKRLALLRQIGLL